MERGNVLVIGNLGSGKTTLINAVLGDGLTVTTSGKKGSAGELAIYDSEDVPFRIIEAVGYEPSLIKEQQTINSIKKWLKESKKLEKAEIDVNVIWFVVDATESKTIPKSIEQLCKATSSWKSVPVIVVITKSYAEPEREKNFEAAYVAYAKQKKHFGNLRKILPVVASTYILNENAFAPPEGLTELIDLTNDLIPEGLHVAEKKLNTFKLNQKRLAAHGMTGAAITAAVLATGVSPIKLSDAQILIPIETKLIDSIAKTYGIEKNEISEPFFKKIIEMGTVGIIAKAVITGVKKIPKIKVATDVINAIVAGVVIFSLGEGAIYMFEQIYLGKKSVEDLNSIDEIVDSEQMPQIMGIIENTTKKIDDKTSVKDIPTIIIEVIGKTITSKKDKKILTPDGTV